MSVEYLGLVFGRGAIWGFKLLVFDSPALHTSNLWQLSGTPTLWYSGQVFCTSQSVSLGQ